MKILIKIILLIIPIIIVAKPKSWIYSADIKIPYCSFYIGITINNHFKKDLKICENHKKGTYTLTYDNKKVIYSKESLKKCNKFIFNNNYENLKICYDKSALTIEKY